MYEFAAAIRAGTIDWKDIEKNDMNTRLKWCGLVHRDKRTPGRFMMRLRLPNGITNADSFRYLVQSGGAKGTSGKAVHRLSRKLACFPRAARAVSLSGLEATEGVSLSPFDEPTTGHAVSSPRFEMIFAESATAASTDPNLADGSFGGAPPGKRTWLAAFQPPQSACCNCHSWWVSDH